MYRTDRVSRGARGRSAEAGGEWLVLLFLLAVSLLAGLATGCRTTGTGVRPPEAFVAPEWNDLHIQSLAFLGVGSSAGDETARQQAERIVERSLGSGQDRFIILGLNECRSKATHAGAADVLENMVSVWRNDRKADILQVQALCHKLQVDGIILADLSDWIQEKVDWNSEGSSYTQVAIRLAIYSGKTGLLAWEATKIQRKESLPYRPGGDATGIYTDNQGVSRAEHPDRLTPDAPPPGEVATEAMEALMAAFPPRPASS